MDKFGGESCVLGTPEFVGLIEEKVMEVREFKGRKKENPKDFDWDSDLKSFYEEVAKSEVLPP